jgi:hypothetical protein
MAASKESQGLQIAVIIFAVLTILLAVTTYIFYAQSEENLTKRVDAENAARQAKVQTDKMTYRAGVLQYVIGDGGLDRATATTKGPGVTDDVADRVLKNFDEDMALYGNEAGADGAKNYRTLPTYLIASLNAKQVAMVDSAEESKRVTAKSAQDLTAAEGRVQAAETAMTKAADDLKNQRETYNQDRSAITAEKDKLVTQLSAKDTTIKQEREKAAKDASNLSGTITQLTQTAENLRKKKIELENSVVNRFEAPDGRVTLVNQAQRLAWVNVGSKDGLQRQTAFAVFDHDENGVANAVPKGRIEVVRVVGDHLAECRILEDKAANPIMQNDVIFTPAWSPGQKVHFALVGFMDYDRDGVSDRDMIRNWIQMSGGVVDAELHDDGQPEGSLSVNTRYMVLGEKPTEKSSNRMLSEYNKLLTEATRYGTESINVQKLMSMMGVKPEERTVELGKSAGAAQFKQRKPGVKPAPAAATPAAEAADPGAAPAPAPAPVVDDPFN